MRRAHRFGEEVVVPLRLWEERCEHRRAVDQPEVATLGDGDASFDESPGISLALVAQRIEFHRYDQRRREPGKVLGE